MSCEELVKQLDYYIDNTEKFGRFGDVVPIKNGQKYSGQCPLLLEYMNHFHKHVKGVVIQIVGKPEISNLQIKKFPPGHQYEYGLFLL